MASTDLALQEGKALTLLHDLELGGSLSTIGFTLPEEVTPEQFVAIGRLFDLAAEGLRFAIGDWFLQGESLFGDEVYQYATDAGISDASLQQYIRVSKGIPIERRHPDLTWSHHRAVYAMPEDEQTTWLKRAAESGWSKTTMEEHIAAQREPREQKPRQLTLGRGYEVTSVLDVAEKLYNERGRARSGWYRVPAETMDALGAALSQGQDEGETE